MELKLIINEVLLVFSYLLLDHLIIVDNENYYVNQIDFDSNWLKKMMMVMMMTIVQPMMKMVIEEWFVFAWTYKY